MPESKQAKSRRTAQIISRLAKQYPDARVLLDYSTPLELLVATILAAQCTDARVNQTTPDIFAKYKTAEHYARATLEELQDAFKQIGLFRNKSKAVKAACTELVETHNGEVPDDIDSLAGLTGVGRKTANVVLGNAFGKPAVIVDTHVLRMAGRLGLASRHNVEKKYADKIEKELMELAPRSKWTQMSHLLTWHGRNICVARKPRCPICPVSDLCPYTEKTR
jgi:endonuclease-3